MISLCFHWLLTYLVHSTVLLTAAALLDWRRRLTGRGIGSPLWRIALFGGFVTATLQPVLASFFFDPGSAVFDSHGGRPGEPFPALALSPLHADAIDLAPLIVPIWLGVACFMLVLIAARLFRVTRVIARMPRLSSPSIERVVHQLAVNARICAPELRVATGSSAPLVAPGHIICIPPWMLANYESDRLSASLAHEMGHLRRHDNQWRIGARVATYIGWLQPLNWLAANRMNESAELACDAWAAEATGLRRELAYSLEDCAIRLGTFKLDTTLTTGMTARRFMLLERVKKLLDGAHVNTRELRRAKWWSAAAMLGVAVVGVFVVVATLDDDVPPAWLAENGLYQSLQNSSENVQTSRSVIINSPERYVYVRVANNFTFEARPSVGRESGTAVIAETRGGVTRSVRFDRDANSTLRRTYKVDGFVRPLDSQAERWLDSLLPLASDRVGAR